MGKTSFRLGRAVMGIGIVLATACGSGGEGSPGSGATPTPPPGATPPPAPSGVPSPTPTASQVPPLRLSLVAAGLERPVFVASPGDPRRLFVVEQPGRIRLLVEGELSGAPFLDITEEVSCCNERGLLGLAFHPSYGESGRFFVDYTDANGDTVIAEYARAPGDPARANPTPTRVLLRIDQPFANHNGGMLVFGPDGFLYVGMGDGGSAGDPRNNAQNLSVKLGKLLRIDVDRHPEPPPGNLAGADPDVWAYGLRNPWRFSFDRSSGDLYVGDVGQNRFEEVDVAAAGEGSGNYGWPIMEALHCFRPSEGCDPAGLILPAVEYPLAPECSVIGGYVYRGQAIPGLVGRYLYGDHCSNRIWSFRWRDGQVEEQLELTADLEAQDLLAGLTSFGEDAAGELHVMSLGGEVYRIERE